MPIYVINLRRALRLARPVVILSSLILIVSILIVTIGSAHSDARYSEVINQKKEWTVIIDAGHGGEDSGAVGVSGDLEKNLNLEISLLIGEELINRGYKVVYTRTEDKMLYSAEENIKGMRKISDLKNRCKISFEYENPIFISVHMNSYGSSKYSGLQVYYTDGNDESKSLANKIQNSVKTSLQTENTRQIKNGKNLYLLENCNGTAVLVECGFLSNTDECKKLSEKEYQKQLSFAIICGIIEYIGD